MLVYSGGTSWGQPFIHYGAVAIKDGDRVRVNLNTGEIFDLTQNITFSAKPIPVFMQQLVKDGGLIPHLRKAYKKKKRSH
jgi:3-isopropylmalate/(R)-2-methylmalate dehydratase small subunit